MWAEPPDYEAIEREQWRKAPDEVVKEAHRPTDRLLRRIATFISRFGYEEDEVLHKIRQDHMFAANFAKEPRRTGLHEAEAARWIRQLPGVEGFKTLPKKGDDSFKVSSDGNIVSGKEKNLPGKSLDFHWMTGSTDFYAMHKYTKEGGGNQDSQYKEMIDLMKRFLLCDDRDVALAVIVDGDYYQRGQGKHLKELQRYQRTNRPHSYALSIGQLPKILEAYR